MFCTHGLVLKAARKRPRWEKTRSPKRLEALARRFGSAVALDLQRGINTFRRYVPDPERVYEAWMSGGWDGVSRVIPWDRLDSALEPAARSQREGMAEFGAVGLEAIPAPARRELRYDYANPSLQALNRRRTAEWVVGVTDGTRQSIRQVVEGQMTSGADIRQMAHRIKDVVGLYPRLARAHQNYVDGLVKAKVSPAQLDRLAERHYQRLLEYRARTIAKTETQFMANRGQYEVWKEAARQELLPRHSEKSWIADGDPCEDCADMDGETVPLHDSWDTPGGDSVETPSDIHPNCECLMGLEY